MQTKFRKSDLVKEEAGLTDEEKETVQAQNAEIDLIH